MADSIPKEPPMKQLVALEHATVFSSLAETSPEDWLSNVGSLTSDQVDPGIEIETASTVYQAQPEAQGLPNCPTARHCEELSQ
jgi:hypothetical protein